MDLAFTGNLEKETPKAYGLTVPAFKGTSNERKVFWLPKSRCSLDGGVFTLPEWLVKERDLDSVGYRNGDRDQSIALYWLRIWISILAQTMVWS